MNLLCTYIGLFRKVVGLHFTHDTTPTSCITHTKTVKIPVYCHNVQLLLKKYASMQSLQKFTDITVMPEMLWLLRRFDEKVEETYLWIRQLQYTLILFC